MDFEYSEDVEDLYMPSRWVKRMPGDESLAEYAKWTKDESDKARALPSARLDIQSGNTKVDIFNEDGSSGKLIVFISGGYWVFGCGSESAWTVLPLVGEGHTVAVIHYDRAPQASMTNIVKQVEFGLDWIIKFAIRKNKKVWLSGHSAGSQLCAMALSSFWFSVLSTQEQQSVAGVIHLSGVFDLEPILKTSVQRDLQLTEEEVKKYSPLSSENIDRICSYKHIIHHQMVGEFDSPAFHQQANDYRKIIEDKGCMTSLTVMPNLDHFNLALDLSYPDTPSTNKFIQLLNQC